MENQRTRLSKTLLKNALIELLRHKSIEKITVYEICNTAQINRTTFYKYYGSPYDLLEDIEKDLFAALESNLLSAQQTELDKLKELTSFLYAGREKWKILINAVDDRNFTGKLYSLPGVAAIIHSRMRKELSAKNEEYIRLFFCQGGYAILRKWLNEKEPENPEEIAALLDNLGRAIL